MSSKIKNIFYIILMIMIMGLISLIPSQTKAVSVEETMQLLTNISNSHAPYSGTVPLRFGILQQRHDLYCLGYEVNFHDWQIYRNAKYIRITGNTATDYTSGVAGTSVTHVNNGILAYIISTNGGYGYAPGVMENLGQFSETQSSIYKFINTWFATAGNSFGLGGWGHPNNNAFTNNSYNIYTSLSLFKDKN